MQSHLLKTGTMLDDRYRILSVLGQGGFGITYAAENLRIGLRVAIKELFWRGYSVRNAEISPRVEISDEQHAPMFRAHKDNFLREARIIRDFSGMPGVVQILDYFEANDTAYIVMEYVEGETLAVYLRRKTRIPADELFARFLPLTESLSKIHAGGIIHRDISPDNIMVRPDGSLTLIDFGAARAYRAAGEIKYTTLTKESFAPSEQYDKNGRQGPWTDVYALCATLYACVTGFPPISSMQRMFLDELKKPSELGLEITPAFEAIIMKGMEMTAANRYADMADLAQAIQGALPHPKDVSGRRTHSALIGMIAGLLCAALVLLLFFLHENRAADPFRGIETETFCLIAPEDMTASAFAQVQTDVAARLEAFAGKDNYLLKTEGDRLYAVLPLESFDGQEIYSVLKAEFMPLVNGKRYNMEYELKGDWEDPSSSVTPGKNQVLPSALAGKTVMLSYTWDSALSLGQRANLMMDFKVRLDALDTHYAFGTLYGDANTVVIRISPDRLNQFVLDSLGDSGSVLHIAGDYNGKNLSFYAPSSQYAEIQPVQYDDGSLGLNYSMMYEYQYDNFQKLIQALRDIGEDTLYLQSSGGYALAEIDIAEAMNSETIEFRTFRFENTSLLDAGNLWVVEYVDALLNQTDLPTSCMLKEVRMLDENGRTLLGESISYGTPLREKECNDALLECLRRFIRENGFSGRAGDSDIQIRLNLEVDENLVKKFTAAVEMLLNDYGLKDMVVNYYLEIVGINELPGESFSVTLDTGWYVDRHRWINDMDCWISTDGRLAPYTSEFAAWWESLSEETVGVTTD